MGASKNTEMMGELNIPMPGEDLAAGPERMAGSALGIGGGEAPGLEQQAGRSYGEDTYSKSTRSKFLNRLADKSTEGNHG